MAPTRTSWQVPARPAVTDGSGRSCVTAAARQRQQPLECKSRSFMPAPAASLKRPLPASCRSAGALLITPESLFLDRRVQIATLALRHGVPAIYANRAFAEAGGLMSYGANIADAWRQAVSIPDASSKAPSLR